MRPGPAAIALGALLSLILLLPGCGEGGAATAGGGVSPRPQATTSGKSLPEAGARAGGGVAKPRVSHAARRCRRSLGGLLDSIESLANAVAVGLDYEDYLAAVNRVRATYADVPAKSLSLPCLTLAAGPAERALNLYITAANTWGDCLATPSCNPASVEPKLQRRWETAGDMISTAQRGLRSLG